MKKTKTEIIKKRYPFYDENIAMKDIELNGEQVQQLMQEYAVSEFEEFYFEMGEDFNLWDEEIEPYPAERILTAMKNKLVAMKIVK